MQAVLKAQINKTDRNDARGIAQMMRAGLYRPVHVEEALRSQKLRMLLTHRQLLQSKAIAVENDLRGTLRNFGLKVGMVGKVKFEARIRELVENQPDLAVLVEPMLIVRRVLREQIVILHRRLLAIVRDDEVCRRLMTTPGVGPVVSLTYRATVDVPARFHKSKSVGAVFGLTCAKYQSGEIDRSGRISRCGDEMMRVMLYEAAPEHAAVEAALRDVEDDAVRILELPLEIAVTLVAKIEEEFAAGSLDALLRLGHVVDLEAEMMGADMALRAFEVGGFAAGGAGEIEQRQIDDAVAHIDGRTDLQILAVDPLKIENRLVELRGLVEIVHADGEMAKPGHV